MSPLLSSRFIFIAIFRQVSPFLPPFLPPVSPVPSPIATPGELGRRSFHAGAQTLYFQQKPASEGDGRRAGAALGSGPATGSPPAPAPWRAELTEEPGAAPGPITSKCSRLAGDEEEALRCSRPGNGCRDQTLPAALSSRRPRERAGSGRTEGAPRKPARRSAASSPALRLCAVFGPGTQVRWHSSAEGHRARRPLEQSQSARQRHTGCGEKGSVSGSREGSHQAKAAERALRGSSELSPGLSASFKPSGSRPQLERRARNLKTLYSPRFPQPSPSPCESWGLPCPPAPSARWVFFLVFL